MSSNIVAHNGNLIALDMPGNARSDDLGGIQQGLAGLGNTFPAGTTKNSRGAVEDKLRNTCEDTSWAVLAECQNEPGKFFAKRIYCGKEWCIVCGEKRSKHHNRKIARVLPKAMQIQDMGYFVIEFPDRYRKIVSWAYSRKAIDIASKTILDTLAGKRMGRRGRVGGFFSRGLMRWHWFGDKMNGKWNPHCNVLVDGKYLEKDELQAIKQALKAALNCPDLIVHYSYCETPAQKFQKVEYITRATFRNYDWNPYMANQLYGFRNQRWWGKWDGEAVWHAAADQESELLAADSLEQNTCPDCGGELKWTRPFNALWLHEWQAVEVGNTGYYRIPAQVFDGDVLSPEDILRLDKMRELHVADLRARVRERLYPMNELLEYMDGEEYGDDYEELSCE